MTDLTGAVYVEIEIELLWAIRQDAVNHKTRQDNDVINHKGVISVEYNIELSRSIQQCMVYDEDENGQWRDWSHRSSLHWKRN